MNFSREFANLACEFCLCYNTYNAKLRIAAAAKGTKAVSGNRGGLFSCQKGGKRREHPAYNPRRQLKPGEKEYEALKASISRWSLVEPLVVNLRTGNLVGGHQRYNVLLDLGHTEAEAAVVDLDEKQEKLLNVALNRIEGQWDYEKLQDLFEEFSAEDIFATGYSDGELKTLFGGEDEGPTDLYQDDPEPEEDDSGGDTEEDDGEFSIYLSFPTRQAAEEWLEGEGIERGFPRGGRNLVIHMEGDSYEDTRN